MLTHGKIIAICATLQSVPEINGERGRDIAATLYGLHTQGKEIDIEVAIEQLPDSVREDLCVAAGGDFGFKPRRPQPTIIFPVPVPLRRTGT